MRDLRDRARALGLVVIVLAAGLVGCTSYRVVMADGGDVVSGAGGAGSIGGSGGGAGGSLAGFGGSAAGGGGIGGSSDGGRPDSSGSGGAAGSGAGGVAGGGAGGTAGSGAGGAGGTSGCVPSCSSTQICIGTKCLLADGQICTLAMQCASGACSPYYADTDADGYGAGAATGFCGTTPPVGYAVQSGDCCDDSTHPVAKLIHPGAGFQTSSANGVCGGITWDYDCDGTIETSKEAGKCSATSVFPNNCVDVFHYYPESDCGMVESTYTCIGYISSCTEYPSPDSGPLGCR